MKTAEEKAVYWLNDNVAGWTDTQLETLTLLLEEQDSYTRHACSDAVIKCKEICETATGNCVRSILMANSHNAVMNTRSV